MAFRRERKQSPAGKKRPSGPGAPVPARLRAVTASGHGHWNDGTLRLTPGSLLWVPDREDSGQPVELATATILPPSGTGIQDSFCTDIETAAGRFQIEMDPVLLRMSQELVADGPSNPAAGPVPQPPGTGAIGGAFSEDLSGDWRT